MLKFILDIAIMLSLGVMIYMVARALPRIDDADTSPQDKIKMPSWVMLYLEKMDVMARALFEKNLRRFKVWLLKINNWVDFKLKSFKKDERRDISVSTNDTPNDDKSL